MIIIIITLTTTTTSTMINMHVVNNGPIEDDIRRLLPSSAAALNPLCNGLGVDTQTVLRVLQQTFVPGLAAYVADMRSRDGFCYSGYGDDSFFDSYDPWWQSPADPVLDPSRAGALRVHDRAMIVDLVKVRWARMTTAQCVYTC